MKILLASSSANLNGGGISSYAIELLTQLHQKHSLFLISDDIINEEYDYLLTSKYQLKYNDFSQKNIRDFIILVKIIEPEIIINSNFRVMALAIPYIDKQITNISISHFVDGPLAISAGFNNQFYDSIIALSQEGKIFLDNYYSIKDKEKVKVVYNFSRAFINHQALLKEKLKNTEIIITYPGGGNIYKNAHLVYQLVKELVKTKLNFKFIWIGDTKIPGSKFLKERRISELLQKDDRIIFTGFIGRDKAIDLITKANIFLLPSLKEGCAISLLEALSVGVISIISDSKHASMEIIENNKTGFILPKDSVDEYLKLISNIILNHNRYLEIYYNSKRLHESQLTDQIWEQKMNEIFYLKNVNVTFQKKISSLHILTDRVILRSKLSFERLKQIKLSIKARRTFVKS